MELRTHSYEDFIMAVKSDLKLSGIKFVFERTVNDSQVFSIEDCKTNLSIEISFITNHAYTNVPSFVRVIKARFGKPI